MQSFTFRLVAFYAFFALITLNYAGFVGASDGYANVSGLYVALSVLPFVDGMKLPNGGGVYFSKVCSEGGCSLIDGSMPQDGAWSAYAYLSLYNVTGDPYYLEKARKEMDDLLVKCPPESNVCGYIGVQSAMAFDIIGERRYLDYLTEGYTKLHESGMLDGISSRQDALAYMHGLGDKRGEAVAMLDAMEYQMKEYPVLFNTQGGELVKDACWIKLGYLEIARSLESENPRVATNIIPGVEVNTAEFRRSLISDSKSFFRRLNVSSIDPGDVEFFKTPLVQLEPCVESLLILHELTGDDRYLNDSLFLLQLMVDRWWDSKYSPRFDGDGAFNAQGCRRGGGETACYNNMKYINDNGYAVYLFSLVKDYNFQVPLDETTVLFGKPAEDPYYITRTERPLAVYYTSVALILSVVFIAVVFYIIYRRSRWQS